MKLNKLAAVISAAVLAITLTGCGNDSEIPQNGQSVGTNSKPAGNSGKGNVETEVESANATAFDLFQAVGAWSADDVIMGAADKVPCELKITMNNGKATVSDSSGKNNWGKKGDPGKEQGTVMSLEERIEDELSGCTFTAAVFIDESEFPAYCWIVSDTADFNGAAPTENDFKSGLFNWGSGTDGVLSTGEIMGTCPKLYSPG